LSANTDLESLLQGEYHDCQRFRGYSDQRTYSFDTS
jgi:hypothetical protein